MKIRYVEGDITLAKTDAIAHGIAPHDDFKQGLALTLREHWPALYKDFRHFCHVKNPSSGTLWTWKGVGTFTVYNLFTQEPPPSAGQTPGKATLSNVNHCLRELVKQAKQDGIKSLSITKISTGVGGLSWDEVKPILEKQLKELGIPVLVYEGFKKGVAVE